MALNPTNSNSDKSKKDEEPEKLSAEDEVALREIDEAVRKDDLDQFAKKYGALLLGGLAAILLAFGGYLYWDGQKEAELELQSEQLVQALDQAEVGNFAAASESVADVAANADGGARASALMLQAGAAIEQGNPDQAVELYAQVSADESAPPALRDLATIREMATNYDDREPAEVIDRLSALAVPGNAFFGSAGELTAMAHLNAGENEQAGTLFAAIAKDEDVPQSLRARARQMAGLLGIDAIEDPEQLLEDEGVIQPDGAGADAADAAPVGAS
ncbi:MAG: tetratricopeptide repeat protein [Erythrobacter sp.]